ncbi:hypothetical protein [Pseudomonas putida]|uniref:hypothetical protein n=1 Tax=Pseudomonas putida TaxID=303 RepID=UPI00236390BA|nr:hypothetical protein [Pseudomonas putida]MDD1990558.1 hypothetical protein [Pseudomonas putida]HDS1796347.1 hypothetical protein [Pseudomonas putida]
MSSEEQFPETASVSILTGVGNVLDQLHKQCSRSVDSSLHGENGARLAESYLFASDLDAWTAALDEQLESALIKTAASEYVLSTLNVCQGQYRNGFKGLRLVLELCLQSTYLSSNLVLRAEWLKGEADTIWATLVDDDNGPLSQRTCRAFFPELLEHVEHFKQLAKTLYRELSECIHGNVPNHIPLPDSLSFSQEAFDLWQSKAKLVRFVVLFALVMRHTASLPAAKRSPLEAAVYEQLGHIEAIRDAFINGN